MGLEKYCIAKNISYFMYMSVVFFVSIATYGFMLCKVNVMPWTYSWTFSYEHIRIGWIMSKLELFYLVAGAIFFYFLHVDCASCSH